MMVDLFNRLVSTRKRVIVKRQLTLLEKLLNTDGRIEFYELAEAVKNDYISRKSPINAVVRDINRLYALGAVSVDREGDQKNPRWYISVRLDWPSRITETEFFNRIAQMPKSKTYGFLTAAEP